MVSLAICSMPAPRTTVASGLAARRPPAPAPVRRASRCAAARPAFAPLLAGARPSFVALRATATSEVDIGRVTILDSRAAVDAALAEAGDALVVMAIGSSRCGPCKMVFPKVCALSTEFTTTTFVKIEGDANKETVGMMKEWQVKAVPEFRFFRRGELVHKHSGADANLLREHIEKHL